jgi:hypothetical protein
MPIFYADNKYQLYLAIRLAIFAWQGFKVEKSSSFEPVPARWKTCCKKYYINPYPFPFLKSTKYQRFDTCIFELCRRTQQLSLTFRQVGGSTFGLWTLFHLRYGGKWTEMTATHHGGTLRH